MCHYHNRFELDGRFGKRHKYFCLIRFSSYMQMLLLCPGSIWQELGVRVSHSYVTNQVTRLLGALCIYPADRVWASLASTGFSSWGYPHLRDITPEIKWLVGGSTSLWILLKTWCVSGWLSGTYKVLQSTALVNPFLIWLVTGINTWNLTQTSSLYTRFSTRKNNKTTQPTIVKA